MELEIDRMILLIWDFVVHQDTAPTLGPQKGPYDTNDMQFAPMIDVSKTDCNCSNFPSTSFIFKDNDNLVKETSSEGRTSHNLLSFSCNYQVHTLVESTQIIHANDVPSQFWMC